MAETGEALYTIREKRLFRAEYASFEDYVRKRWNMPMELVKFAIPFYLAKRN
jgi:HD-like signal output (HDOD) protein